jgi:tRNA(fMet)-specific endonuclease VapC
LADRLLDANAVGAVMKGHRAMEGYLADLESAYHLSVVVEGEVRFGIARLAPGRKRRTLAHAFDQVLSGLESVLPISSRTARVYSTLKADLWKRGMAMGENDLWIAATAIEHRLILVTSDRAFAQLPRLPVEDWQGT